MKIAMIGGKTLLDGVFLNALSSEVPNLNIECFGDSGSVSFGSKILNINDIKNIKIEKFDIIINLSIEYDFVFELVTDHNENCKKKVKYLNFSDGKLAISSLINNLDDLLLIPEYGVEAICRFLDLFKDALLSVDVYMNQPIAELGKDAMNRFYKEIKDSALRVIQYSDDNKDPLAFNISYVYPQDENVGDFKDSISETKTKNQLCSFIGENSVGFLNQSRIPVNKGSSVLLTFELKEEISEKAIKKDLENAGFIYSKYGFSTILVENDVSIYVTKLKKIGKKYSVILLFDSVLRSAANISEILFQLLNNKN